MRSFKVIDSSEKVMQAISGADDDVYDFKRLKHAFRARWGEPVLTALKEDGVVDNKKNVTVPNLKSLRLRVKSVLTPEVVSKIDHIRVQDREKSRLNR